MSLPPLTQAQILRELAAQAAGCAVAAAEKAAIHRRRAADHPDLDAVVGYALDQAKNRDADRDVYLAREAALLAGARALESQHAEERAA